MVFGHSTANGDAQAEASPDNVEYLSGGQTVHLFKRMVDLSLDPSRLHLVGKQQPLTCIETSRDAFKLDVAKHVLRREADERFGLAIDDFLARSTAPLRAFAGPAGPPVALHILDVVDLEFD